MKEMVVLGIIPARSGSKRIKDKNIKLLHEKPLMQYSIETAAKSSSLDRFIVSTNSKEYSSLARSWGAEVPFIRPEEISGDKIPDKPVLQHALNWFGEKENYYPDAVAILRPTAPFRSVDLINKVVQKFIDDKPDSIRTATKVEGVHHPYWMYSIDESGKAKPLDAKKNADNYYQSQMLPPFYRLNGVMDIISSDTILNPSEPLYGKTMHLFATDPLISLDIDTEFDFLICESLLKNRKINL